MATGDTQRAVTQLAYEKKLIDSPEAERLDYGQVAAVVLLSYKL